MKRKKYSDKSNVLVLSLLLIEIGKLSFNSLVHKMGPQGPKQHIFRDQLYSKNARNLRFHVFLLFYARKHKTLSFYLKWTEFTRKCEFFTIQFRSVGTHNWSKIHDFQRIQSISGKMMISYVFQPEKGGIHRI